jgi:hypothetical protein
MKQLFLKAIRKAEQVRHDLKQGSFSAINIFESCANLGLTVRFIDVNMEGMYVSQNNGTSPTILLSNQRPLPRRVFTCAHELGHHVFGHGTRVDTINERAESNSYDADELLVDAFAGALLMPVGGIQKEFSRRKWKPSEVSHIHFFIISSVFGVGYQTLVTHCCFNGIIDENKKTELLKYTPSKILQSVTNNELRSAHFKIIDDSSQLTTIDLEVSNYIFLPAMMRIESDHLTKQEETLIGTQFIAERPGIARVKCLNSGYGFFIRIQNLNYVGLAEYRHLENKND